MHTIFDPAVVLTKMWITWENVELPKYFFIFMLLVLWCLEQSFSNFSSSRFLLIKGNTVMLKTEAELLG